MNDKPAAFSAVYSDWKLIKTRACVQIVLEVPLEASGQAYDALGGMPNEKTAVWCAVARLKPEEEKSSSASGSSVPSKPDAERAKRIQDWADLEPSVQSGILRNTEAFWRYLEEELKCAPIYNSEHAAQFIRTYCGVVSCADLTADNGKWTALYRGYRAWMHEPELAGSKCG